MNTERFKIIITCLITIALNSCSQINEIGSKNKVGIMPSELIYGCEGEQIEVLQNGAVPTKEGVGVYVLHIDSLFNYTIISLSKTGIFDDPKIYCTKLYVSYLFGPDNGDGMPDINSKRRKTISSTPVMWMQSIQIDTDAVCDLAGNVEISFKLNEGCNDIYKIFGDVNIEEAKVDTVYSFKVKEGVTYNIKVIDKSGCISSRSELMQCQSLGAASTRMFPFPPPKASAVHVLDKSMFKNSKQLSEIDSILSNVLDSCGYSEKSYHQVPNGFALITRMEKINNEVVPLSNAERWHTSSMLDVWDFDLSSYFNVLLNSRQGKYRVFAFIVTDKPFIQSENSFKLEEAEKFLFYGFNVLPVDIGKIKISDLHVCTVLVYEFNKRAQGAGEFIETSNFLGKDHLTKNNFLNCLEGLQK